MTFEQEVWARLLAFLGTLGDAKEVAPGRVALDLPGDSRTLELVMTRDEWLEMISVPWGDFDGAAEDVRQSVLAATADDRFLVYSDYRLEPSAIDHLAPDADLERLDRLLRDNGGRPIGSWVTYDHEGREHRLRDFPDELSD